MNCTIIRLHHAEWRHPCSFHKACEKVVRVGTIISFRCYTEVVKRVEEKVMGVFLDLDGSQMCQVRFLPKKVVAGMTDKEEDFFKESKTEVMALLETTDVKEERLFSYHMCGVAIFEFCSDL